MYLRSVDHLDSHLCSCGQQPAVRSPSPVAEISMDPRCNEGYYLRQLSLIHTLLLCRCAYESRGTDYSWVKLYNGLTLHGALTRGKQACGQALVGGRPGSYGNLDTATSEMRGNTMHGPGYYPAEEGPRTLIDSILDAVGSFKIFNAGPRPFISVCVAHLRALTILQTPEETHNQLKPLRSESLSRVIILRRFFSRRPTWIVDTQRPTHHHPRS